jgi:hypothetical protein
MALVLLLVGLLALCYGAVISTDTGWKAMLRLAPADPQRYPLAARIVRIAIPFGFVSTGALLTISGVAGFLS